ncbi:UNVERIFIED_CONTAM: hypothetical protein K2H54_000485 [Gekko kuhli]
MAPEKSRTLGTSLWLDAWNKAAGLKRQKKAKSSKKTRHQPSGKVNMNVVTDTAKLLLACPLALGGRQRDRHPLMEPREFSSVGSAQPVSHVFPRKVLDLRNKYLSAAQEPPGKPNGRTKNSGPPEGPPNSRLFTEQDLFSQEDISMPLDKSR